MSRASSYGVLCVILGALGCEAAPVLPKPPAPVTDTRGQPTGLPTSANAVLEVVDSPGYRVAGQRMPDKVEYKRVFSVPDGPKGLWTNRNPVSDGANGPQGCAVDDDGSFWFIDSGDGLGMFTRFVHYSKNGKRLGVYPTEGHQLESLLAMGGHLYARDLLRTALVRFSREGKLEQKLAYSGVGSFARLGDQVSALRSIYPTPLLNAEQDLAPGAQTKDFNYRGVHYLLSKDAVQVGTRRTAIEATNAVLFMGLLGLSAQGDLLVSMYNDSGPDPILRFDAKGTLTGQAWMPKESVISVAYPLCMDAKGDVFATITREKRIDLVKLTFAPVVL